MTTTTTRTPAAATGPRHLTGTEHRGAWLASGALLTIVILSVPATALLDRAEDLAVRATVATAFLVVAVLDVAAGWGLHLLLWRRALPSSVAALVSRTGYAVLLGGSALALLLPGGEGAAGFRADWSLALVVLGVHLVIAAVALWRSRLAPGLVVATIGMTGAASLLDDVPALSTDVTGRAVLVPWLLGELVLMAWLMDTLRQPRALGPT